MNLPQPLRPLAPVFEQLGEAYGVDPAILAAIAWRESKGLTTCIGDAGHGHGLWQVDDRSHYKFLTEKLPDGTPAWQNPLVSGAYVLDAVLLPALRKLSGDMFLALAAYNAGLGHVLHVLGQLPPDSSEAARHLAAEEVTAGGDYASYVLDHAARFKGDAP